MSKFTQLLREAKLQRSLLYQQMLLDDEEEIFANTVIQNPEAFEENPEMFCHSLSFSDRKNLNRVLESRKWSEDARFELKLIWSLV